MGILEAPAPLFSWLDAQMEGLLPPWGRLVAWGALAALVSMGLYRALSAQGRIARGKRELARARRELDGYDGELGGAWPLIRHLLRTAFGQVGRVGGPAVAASLPLLSLLIWLSTAYGYAYPPAGTEPELRPRPAELEARWREARRNGTEEHAAPRVVVADGEGRVVAEVALREPVPILHKWRWWNALVGNPAGYLPDEAAVERVELELPRQEVLPLGPSWARGWELSFFLALIAASVALKVLFRIE
ncbi:hypothetical protein AN478_09300 [Thiohalorhabdus denitrificans]|uniref:Uncharacterized protein n=1 Tax=Thiohalorhabdus denitrificans TaxID=381306 RepID=A0A0P9C625_9GAMM|nr:hypothetical protein [Thiohalorhabdus denitrificans]KPV40284.1 hypothetical protein AN478_09300 [Thiohalorhabdus denitrificans]SCX81350.1 hypothetical protein SAMN05661077_0544 [Thiohalorhabdus denitrificans]